jgi:hypothetical protein
MGGREDAMNKSKSFYLTTAPTANHMIMAYEATYEVSEVQAKREIERLDLDPDELDTNEVFFTTDEDGEVEKLVRVDGGKLYWSLGNHDVRQLARDIRDSRPGLI